MRVLLVLALAALAFPAAAANDLQVGPVAPVHVTPGQASNTVVPITWSGASELHAPFLVQGVPFEWQVQLMPENVRLSPDRPTAQLRLQILAPDDAQEAPQIFLMAASPQGVVETPVPITMAEDAPPATGPSPVWDLLMVGLAFALAGVFVVGVRQRSRGRL